MVKELSFADDILSKLAVKSLQSLHLSQSDVATEVTALVNPDLRRLQSKMSILSVIITVAPVLGLLGTVLGLMDVFSVIASDGVGQAEQLSAGISKALITTVSGLSIAIPLMFINQYLQSQINDRLDAWDFIPQRLISFCKQKQAS